MSSEHRKEGGGLFLRPYEGGPREGAVALLLVASAVHRIAAAAVRRHRGN